MRDVTEFRVVDEEPAPEQPAARAEPRRSLAEFGDVLTVEEAASVLRISRASAYQAARSWKATGCDGLPVIQIGRRLLVPRPALEKLLASVEGTVTDRDGFAAGG
jgi:hypothetical protein